MNVKSGWPPCVCGRRLRLTVPAFLLVLTLVAPVWAGERYLAADRPDGITLLADLFPEERDAILAFGRDIGWDRVLIGKHFPTDIYAGRVFGQAIVRELKASPAFQRDLAEAKAEGQSVQQAQPVGK